VHDSINLIAVHCSISTPDPMADGMYYGWMMGQIPQTPYMIFDRKYKTTPDQVASLYDQHHNDFAYADMTMGFTLNPDTTVTVAVSVTPVTNLHGTYRLGLVLTEDFVHSTATPSSWDQTNVYAGGSSGVVTDGYYNFNLLPNPVPATYMYYNHVDRTVTPNVYGGYYLPSPMIAGTTYWHTFNNVPLSYGWKTANMHAIGILYDSTTGYILNSANVLFGPDTMTLPPIPIPLQALGNLGTNELMVFPNPATTSLNIMAGYTISSVKIIDVLGHLVYSHNCNDRGVQINVANLTSGIYFVKINGSEVRQFVKR
jgi:hypothetical protein